MIDRRCVDWDAAQSNGALSSLKLSNSWSNLSLALTDIWQLSLMITVTVWLEHMDEYITFFMAPVSLTILLKLTHTASLYCQSEKVNNQFCCCHLITMYFFGFFLNENIGSNKKAEQHENDDGLIYSKPIRL